MKPLKWLIGLVVLVIAATLTMAWWIERYTMSPLHLDAPTVVAVEPGQSLRAVARMLGERGILPQPGWFVFYARMEGHEASLKAGEYRLMPQTTVGELLDQLVRGDVLLHSLTIVEGWTFSEMLAAVQAHPAVVATLDAGDPAAAMAALGEADLHPEGQFFPDTYYFPRGSRDIDLLRRAWRAMQDRLAAGWAERAAELPYERPYEALILASIVEKETGLDAERALIAGVFVGRLRRGMRLQSDPTVIYGIGAAYDGNLRRRDLLAYTPYNTYTRAGLPPTPIALPGAASLRAVMQPAETDALYFVATGEGDGSHHFSATLEEHNAAVQRYLARLREQRGR